MDDTLRIAESPPNSSPGYGVSTVWYDPVTHQLGLNVVFSNLVATGTGTTAAHIHCCTLPTAGVATTTPTFVGFPLGVRGGTYVNTLDLTLASSWNNAFITANGSIAGAETALAAGLNSGVAYLNIHSSTFPAGEIRGFLQPVPEPATLTLVLGGAAAGLWRARRRKRV